MKDLLYQQKAIERLTDETINLLNLKGARHKIVFEAPTGAGKTVMACQTLANIVDELKSRGSSKYQEVAFIWFAPRKLHIQSYGSLKTAFGDTRKLRPVMFDELDQSEGIQAGEILFVNWESVNKDNNIMARDSESNVSIYEIARRTQEELGLPIVAIIDEEHMFWSKTADKSAAVLDRINPAVEIRISATPKTAHPDALVKIPRQEVIAAEMIKKEVILNQDISTEFSDEKTLNNNLIKTALAKRDQIAEEYEELGVDINPLLLIQLPNDTKETMSVEDEAIAEQVKTCLSSEFGITEENGLLAVWLANKKSNLAGLERKNNIAKVLLFKEAIALGWDCPRAAVLLIFRKLESDQFTIQTVGRILRMPEQKHYPKELLNCGYVYTDISKDKIQIVTADADYLLKNTLTAHRRKHLNNITIPAYYSERPNVERNYLGPDFRGVLYREAEDFWNLAQGLLLFSIADLASLNISDNGEANLFKDLDDEALKENRQKALMSKNPIRFDVNTINVPIPDDVHFQNEEQILVVKQIRYARKSTEIDRVFLDFISKMGHKFESKGRTDKIANYLLEMLAEYFGLLDLEAKKVVLYHENKPKFERLINKALNTYAMERERAKRRSAARREFKRYNWEVPEERVYDNETNKAVQADNHALLPFVQLNKASNPEQAFEKYLEANTQYIDWWYKNGDSGKQHYAIPYGEDGNKNLFYVDFVIRMKNGHIYLLDTKSAESDVNAPAKHNALLKYLEENSTNDAPLYGGVILHEGSNWVYSKLPIENTSDTTNWDSFYPQNA